MKITGGCERKMISDWMFSLQVTWMTERSKVLTERKVQENDVNA